jgi:hypothetical protein
MADDEPKASDASPKSDSEVADKSDEDGVAEEKEATRPPRQRAVKKGAKGGKAKKRRTIDAAEAEAEPAPRPALVAASPAEQRGARRALAAGATLGIGGLALVGIGPSDAGIALTLAGLLLLIYGIHTFGRLGPEAV